jgi:hypothetical protein
LSQSTQGRPSQSAPPPADIATASNGLQVNPTKLALSIKDTSEATGLGPTKLWAEIREGRLRARKVGRRTVILPEDLRAWLESLPQR